MLKIIAGVIVGYIVMAVVVMCLAIAAFLTLGADRAFNPGAYTPSMLWIVVTLACGLLAAIVGGYVCAAIGGAGTAPKVLAGIVFVLGIILVLPAFSPASDPRPTARIAGEAYMASLANARQPAWVAAMNPILGAVGVLVGAGIRKR